MKGKIIKINISRKVSSILRVSLPGLLLVATCSINAAPSVTASGYQTTGSGIQHACTGGTVTLSVSGMNTTPPAACCGHDPSASWTYDNTTYSWSGNASGTSATANLDTSTAGEKSASVTLTHHFKCTVGTGTTTTTENASLSSGIKVVANNDTGCTPTKPTAVPSFGIPGTKSVVSAYTLAYWSGLAQIEEWYTGTWSNTKATESYTEDGGILVRGCGRDFQDSRSYGSISVGIRYGSFSFSLGMGGRSRSINIQQKPFERIYGQWYAYNVIPISADFAGTAERKTTYLGNVSIINYNNSGPKQLNAGATQGGWDFSSCTVDCCPSN